MRCRCMYRTWNSDIAFAISTPAGPTEPDGDCRCHSHRQGSRCHSKSMLAFIFVLLQIFQPELNLGGSYCLSCTSHYHAAAGKQLINVLCAAPAVDLQWNVMWCDELGNCELFAWFDCFDGLGLIFIVDPRPGTGLCFMEELIWFCLLNRKGLSKFVHRGFGNWGALMSVQHN